MLRLGPIQFIRLVKIYVIIMRHTFVPDIVGERSKFLKYLSYLNIFRLGQPKKSRGEAVRITLEKLGPIFIKFGQLLSTRSDLIPDDIIDELEKLQDRVQPYDGKIAIAIIEKSFGLSIEQLYRHFDNTPLAAASIAQVHAATLHDGSDVVVKVLRPNIGIIIRHDIALMYFAAALVEKFWKKSKRLHPVQLVAEFERTILDELDLMREAASASQLRRNFENSPMMYVPKVYWSRCHTNVMTMERIYGIQINDITELKNKGVDLKKLAEYGVEIFFTQVFRDSFFHADMHPGNLFVDVRDPKNPRYLGVDFGIMGSLNPEDQHYLASNILAFFNRDYREVALLHVESGWVPPETRIDQFEAAIRTVCEPIFERPLTEISFGQLLLRLFQTAERFQMEVQPQLMLLQKTLLAIEGLGRELYPELDLWQTAKPFMGRFMRKQRSLSKVAKTIFRDWQTTAENIAKTPREFFELLHSMNTSRRIQAKQPEKQPNSSRKSWIYGIAFGLSTTAIISLLLYHHPVSAWQWANIIAALCFWFLGWASKSYAPGRS